jgi:putative transposase
MDQQSASMRTTVTYQLKPTPDQDRALEAVVWHCRVRSNVALDHRTTWWERSQDTRAPSSQQQAAVPARTAACPHYTALNAHVLQDVLLRLDRLDHTFHAVLRRVAAGEAPGDPRFHGQGRYDCCTSAQVGAQGGVRLENGSLVRSTIGRLGVRWSRPIQGTSTTVTRSNAAAGWDAGRSCRSCAAVPAEPVARTGQEPGIDVGLQVGLVRADGERVEQPRHSRHSRHDRRAERALSRAQRRVSRRTQGSHRRRTAVALLRRTQQHVQRQRRDVHHTTARALVRAYDVRSREDLPVRTLVRRPQALPDGSGG